MSFSEIYNDINNMNDVPYNDMYKILIQRYSKIKVEFALYDLLTYESMTIEEREKRKDASFKRDVIERYNNECVISGTDMPCQVCHIKPFNKCTDKEKYDINNALILRDDIHTLFDKKEIKINPITMIVEISDNIMNNDKRKEYHRFNGIKLSLNKKTLQYLKFMND